MPSLEKFSINMFDLTNNIKIVGYFPQIIEIAKGNSGARAVSRTTWTLFATCHVATVAYALINLLDWTVALVFAVNASFCVVIVVMATLKRSSYREPGEVEAPSATAARA